LPGPIIFLASHCVPISFDAGIVASPSILSARPQSTPRIRDRVDLMQCRLRWHEAEEPLANETWQVLVHTVVDDLLMQRQLDLQPEINNGARLEFDHRSLERGYDALRRLECNGLPVEIAPVTSVTGLRFEGQKEKGWIGLPELARTDLLRWRLRIPVAVM
jgi:hypothetical protein